VQPEIEEEPFMDEFDSVGTQKTMVAGSGVDFCPRWQLGWDSGAIVVVTSPSQHFEQSSIHFLYSKILVPQLYARYLQQHPSRNQYLKLRSHCFSSYSISNKYTSLDITFVCSFGKIREVTNNRYERIEKKLGFNSPLPKISERTLLKQHLFH
jgi:hypothetical protein